MKGVNHRFRGIATLLGLLLASCTLSEHSEPPLTLPSSDAIVALSVKDGRARIQHPESTEAPKPTEIHDHGTIHAYMDRLAALNHGWYSPPDTFPSLQITVALVNAKGETVVATWLDSGLLGGREFEPADGGARLIRISPAEYARLLAVLGLPPDPPSRPPA
jgi:hypothetical protein